MWADGFFRLLQRGLDRRAPLLGPGPAPCRDRRRRPIVPIGGPSPAVLAAAPAAGRLPPLRRVPGVGRAPEAA